MSYGFIRVSENEYACVVDDVIVAVKETAQDAVKYVSEAQKENAWWSK